MQTFGCCFLTLLSQLPFMVAVPPRVHMASQPTRHQKNAYLPIECCRYMYKSPRRDVLLHVSSPFFYKDSNRVAFQSYQAVRKSFSSNRTVPRAKQLPVPTNAPRSPSLTFISKILLFTMGSTEIATPALKAGLAQMLKGGVIMDVVSAAQARIAEEAGACAVMALERVPADIRVEGGVARMSDPALIKEIQAAVTIPVMAKARIGHFVECQILEALGVDFIDESEVLTPADDKYHVEKAVFKAPFVCGCRDLGEALRRIAEGASMIRTKGEAGTGDVVEAVKHMRTLKSQIAEARAVLQDQGEIGLRAMARQLSVDVGLLKQTAELGRLPVVNFAAGGVATPADAALMMQLGCDGVFVGSGIFKSGEAAKRAKAIVRATTNFRDPAVLAECSSGLGEAMVGISCASLAHSEKMAGRGW